MEAPVFDTISKSTEKENKEGKGGDKNIDGKGKKSNRSRSRSRERGNRRRRSRSRSRSRGYNKSPDYRRRRLEERDPRTRGRYSRERQRRSPSSGRSRDRSRDRGPRQGRRSRSRSKSNERFQGGRRNRGWKKGPMSPDPQMPPNNFAMPPQQMYDPNVYTAGYPTNQMAYMPNQPPFANYDYSMMQPPPFTAYPPPPQGIIQPMLPGEEFQQTGWPVQPPPSLPVPVQPAPSDTEEEKQRREAAVAQEKKNQRDTLRKQHDDYVRRATALKRELKILKEQKGELIGPSGEPPSPTTSGFIKENDRLQTQILNKISSIENVTDMLRGIIGADRSPTPKPPSPKPAHIDADNTNKSQKKSKNKVSESDDSSPEHLKNKVMESMKKNKSSMEHQSKLSVIKDENDSKINVERVNYNFFDPEIYWCKTCTVFPKTAKEYLYHLHSKEHQEKDKQSETPWRDDSASDELPTYPNASVKRVPIRGLQFFAPSSGWYCKLCSQWMGDLQSASSHLKSKTHTTKFASFIVKNPHYESDWSALRQSAFDRHQLDNPPPPPNISGAPPSNTFLDSIPLQIAQKQKEPVPDDSKKKGKKKKKDKKKRKKSKKKRHSTSSSSSSSSSGSSESEEEPAPVVPEPVENAASIRVTMRNSNKTAPPEQPIVEEDTGGRWTIVQDVPMVLQPPAPLPPTISANGEAAKRKDDLLISQWNVPEPIITEKEKKLLEQLKGKLKTRDDIKPEKREERPPPSKGDERNRRRSPVRDRRDRRSRSPRRSRSARRSRSTRRSRSPRRSPRRSRSPRNRRRSRSRSRSRSRGRRIEKPIVRYAEFRPRVPEGDNEKDRRGKGSSRKDDKSNSPAPKKSNTNTTTSTKRLPFIGRMPVFKKQTTDEEKKDDTNPQLELEKKQEQERKHDEFKFQIQQKQLMVQQQQKHAEQYVMLHANQFANPNFNLNALQIPIITANDEYDDLMPDPMQYVSLMGAPPPPPIEPTIPPEDDTPVLPPGIDEEEVDSIQSLTADPPISRKGALPKDFQDALSIIFDKGASEQEANAPKGTPVIETDISMVKSTYPHGYQPILESDISHHQLIDPTQMVTPMELDEQSQYAMYGTMTDQPLVFNEIPTGVPPPAPVSTVPSVPIAATSQLQLPNSSTKFVDASDVSPALTLPENIPTPPVQILDANGKLMKIPDTNTHIAIEKLKPTNRMIELDDLAMLGIDADDLAAQCI